MLDLGPSWVISIHSLVKRETPRPTIITNFGNHFNPLPRKEGDIVPAGGYSPSILISIHSLVKRETKANIT